MLNSWRTLIISFTFKLTLGVTKIGMAYIMAGVIPHPPPLLKGANVIEIGFTHIGMLMHSHAHADFAHTLLCTSANTDTSKRFSFCPQNAFWMQPWADQAVRVQSLGEKWQWELGHKGTPEVACDECSTTLLLVPRGVQRTQWILRKNNPAPAESLDTKAMPSA